MQDSYSVVEIGQYFMTQDTGDFRQFRMQWLVVSTLFQEVTNHHNQKDGIKGNTRIGPVLEITTSCLCTANMELKSESGL